MVIMCVGIHGTRVFPCLVLVVRLYMNSSGWTPAQQDQQFFQLMIIYLCMCPEKRMDLTDWIPQYNSRGCMKKKNRVDIWNDTQTHARSTSSDHPILTSGTALSRVIHLIISMFCVSIYVWRGYVNWYWFTWSNNTVKASSNSSIRYSVIYSVSQSVSQSFVLCDHSMILCNKQTDLRSVICQELGLGSHVCMRMQEYGLFEVSAPNQRENKEMP